MPEDASRSGPSDTRDRRSRSVTAAPPSASSVPTMEGFGPLAGLIGDPDPHTACHMLGRGGAYELPDE